MEAGGATNGKKAEVKGIGTDRVSIVENVYWKELSILIFIWIAFLAFQISKNYTTTCSTLYWVLNLLQVPAAVGVSAYEAVCLYKGWRRIGSRDEETTQWKIHRLFLHCCTGMLAGILGGLLGVGEGFILGPLFLELGIPPQVASATATFAMAFSSSMSVIEYYLLKRFPIPYGRKYEQLFLSIFFFFTVSTVASFVGQHVARKVINMLGRASLIIFILAGTIFVSAISLGGVGVSHMIQEIENHKYMGFENMCSY